jgi:hypothetical protein
MNTSTHRITATATAALVLVLGATVMASVASPHGDGPRNLDLTASAHPTEAAPRVTDQAFDVARVSGRSVSADTSALASATCDGCRAGAAAFHVIYADDADAVEVDNAAVAWSRCTRCGGWALSVQVVVVDRARRVTANNRAFATNAACAHCDTDAAAFQLVVVAPEQERLSRTTTRGLRAWVAQQARLLRAPGPARAQAPRAAATGLAGLVNGDLGSTTESLNVKRR